MENESIFTKIVSWLKWAIPFALGLAVAVVLRKRPDAPVSAPAQHDMAQADKNVTELQQQAVVLEEQHASITEVLKPKPVENKSLEDAVAQFNRDR